VAKQLRCAKCGLALNSLLMAVPQLGSVIEVVEPHKCLKVPLDLAEEIKVRSTTEKQADRLRLNELNFSQKITEVRKSALFNVTSEDKRQKREELVTSTAPDNLLRAYAKDDFSDSGEMEG
jgi:hypothetical protein